MRSPVLQLCLVLASVALPPRPAGAQRPMPAGLHGALPAVVQGSARSALAPMRDTPVPRRPPAWPYVLGGAMLGGAIMAGGLALALQDGESLTQPVAYVPAVAGAAVLGAGGGYLVYRLRF
jgi:hypothetical protein